MKTGTSKAASTWSVEINKESKLLTHLKKQDLGTTKEIERFCL